jgi:hypothetical protein
MPLTVAVAVTVLAPLAFAAAPKDGRPVAVITWSASAGGAAAVAARADGVLVTAGAGNRVVIARAEAPGFAARLYAAGAALVLDGALATACLSPLISLTTVRAP